MFGDTKREIRNLKDDVKELRTQVYCLRGFHDWIVAQGMVIRCKHCHKQAEAMPSESNTQPKG